MFSPDEIATINRVDIRLRFGTHGTRKRHYSQAIRATRELNSDRGDVLAIEGLGYVGYAPAHITPFGSLPLIETQQKFLRGLRRQRTLDAFKYAALEASFRGIEVIYADANHQEWQNLKHLSRSERSLPREKCAIKDIGQCALRLVQNTSHPEIGRPILMLLFGSMHQESMECQFEEEGIAVTSSLMTNGYERAIDDGDFLLMMAKDWLHTRARIAIKATGQLYRSR